MPLLGDWYEHEAEVINLGPDRVEAGDVWFSYVMSLVELVYSVTTCVIKGDLRVAEALEAIRASCSKGHQTVVVGPPFFVLELADHASSQNVRLDHEDRVMVVTAGGWKRYGGREDARDEVSRRVAAAFAISNPGAIRDAFNQVELNTVLVECDAHWKHVPPWVYACTRDPRTLAPTPSGSRGLLSYLDASATSYPCFIVADDIGVVREGRCECGRDAVTLRLERRVAGSGARGCALSMERALERRTR
jgi:long-chain-fatty-acid---luciferin-component ligase